MSIPGTKHGMLELIDPLQWVELQSSAAILEYNVAMTIMTTSSSRQLMASNAKKLLPGYKDTLADPNSKHRYQEKL